MPTEIQRTAERPLAGAVLCCTSVSPELRSRYADYAQQMGAEHKLDLTSDVTHLLVGDTNTLKYKYVAKEREDVKVLRPEWVEAVRDCWVRAEPINLNELEAKFKMPVLAGLKICITGFDDLHFRAQLQKNVVENGGEYTGDLTKDVTHLIAARPEGKKYEYGIQWQKKVVSLQWYQDTLNRGMQLNETLYHPTRPLNEQGIGAWIRMQKPQSPLGKRPREDNLKQEPARKLRRTASAKLGSQSENMWNDIVGGAGFESSSTKTKPSLKTTKSMSAIHNDSKSFEIETNISKKINGDLIYDGKFLSQHRFSIFGFDAKKEEKLRDIILQHGGVVDDHTEHSETEPNESSHHDSIYVVAHNPSLEVAASIESVARSKTIVSELWLEWCMFKKALVSPQDYPLGSILSTKKAIGFENHVMNATGFHGLETLHISKTVTVLGAKYEQVFTNQCSVLICRSSNLNAQKLLHAKQWGVPAVSEDWLWSCITTSRCQPFAPYLIHKFTASATAQRSVQSLDRGLPTKRKTNQASENNIRNEDRQDLRGRDGTTTTIETSTKVNKAKSELSQSKYKSGKDVKVHEDSLAETFGPTNDDSRLFEETNDNQLFDTSSSTTLERPLREISPNSPKRNRSRNQEKPKKPLFRTVKSQSSYADGGFDPILLNDVAQDRSDDQVHEPVPNASTLNGDIQDLLNIKAKAKSITSARTEPMDKKERLLGRALSNLSNSSVTSNIRYSRASSVDTMNTDGIGSEIGSGFAEIKSQERTGGQNPRSFTGRAKTKLSGPVLPVNDINAVLHYSEVQPEEAATPQLTQLAYEDPEESIRLRERLAEKRRQRSRLGQSEEDPHPMQQKETRKIRDDDVLANAGWGAGRRTRRKDRTPPGLKEF